MAISTNKIARLKHYEILETIGEGHFAKVKLAWHALTKGLVAIKVIQKTNQSLSSVKEQFREVDSLRTENHPSPGKLVEVIETEETLFIVMEYLSGGDLKTYLEAKGRVTEGEARGLFRQLVSALQHCHQGQRCTGTWSWATSSSMPTTRPRSPTSALETSGTQERS